MLPYDEVEVLGVNCAFRPNELTETDPLSRRNWPRMLSILPNAGCRFS
jgi:5-methyltetrahydrofolate--homocysteine methyltransferase